MKRNMNSVVAAYETQLKQGDIQVAYRSLLSFVMSLKADFEHAYSKEFSFGNVSPGYLDYSYFSCFNSFLRERKLRFGIVLNHHDIRFELWLMGQNSDVQKKYWELLKSSKWNAERSEMPKYSIIEIVLVERPDFNNLDALSAKIRTTAIGLTEEILPLL